MNDTVAEDLFFQQIEKSVIKEVYPCPERIAITLAAVEMQSKFGDFDPKKHRVGYLNKVGLNQYLPLTVSRHDYAYWQERLFALHAQQRGYNTREAKKRYIELAREIPFFGMTFFEVNDTISTFTAGVAEDGLFLFNPADLSLVRSLTFDVLLNWGRSDAGFFIKFNNHQGEEETLNLHASSIQSKELLALLDEYFALLPEDYKHEDTVPMNPSPVGIPDASLFAPPKKRIFFGKFGSRLEYLKGYYMESCSVVGLHPIRKFCFQIDTAIDNKATLENIDLSGSSLNDTTIEYVTKAIQRALEYVPEQGFPWNENLDIQLLDLSNNDITEEGVSTIVNLFKLTPNLRYFNMSGNIIENKGAMALATGLALCSKIETVILKECSVGNKGIAALIEACGNRDSFTTLNMEDNRITDIGATKTLGKFLESNNTLTHLNLSKNRIEFKGLEAILKGLEKNSALEYFDISDNPIGASKGGMRLVAAIEKNNSLTGLRAADNKFTGEVLSKIGAALAKKKKFEKLDLSNNLFSQKMDKAGAKEFAQFLSEQDCELAELNLDNNELDSEFGEALADALKTNNSLTVLSLKNNFLATSEGSLPDAWSEMLKSNSKLERLDLSYNGIKSAGFFDLIDCLCETDTLRELFLDGNHPEAEALNSLATFVANSENCHLETLSLSNTDITDEIVEKMAAGLKDNKKLKILILSQNKITNAGAEHLVKALADNETLRELNLGNNAGITNGAALSKKFISNTNVETIII
eukprot:GEZU01014029.1.p1 GENE.GEZU01014029.1~~GEZU01014029.1.p1  ORF type:complete len:825 (-),score=258.10 GEZU01014029.1:123-2384(-)